MTPAAAATSELLLCCWDPVWLMCLFLLCCQAVQLLHLHSSVAGRHSAGVELAVTPLTVSLVPHMVAF
jgi:hypothetical protein